VKLSELINKLSLKEIAPFSEDICPSGVYAGDLLSRAMSRIECGNLWITIMSNANVVAVASLTEASIVILAEGVELLPEAKEAAISQSIGVYSSEDTVYELCKKLGELL
jgi:hypothetical protein